MFGCVVLLTAAASWYVSLPNAQHASERAVPPAAPENPRPTGTIVNRWVSAYPLRPVGRDGHAMAHDPLTGGTFIYGGNVGNPFSETLRYTGGNRTWTPMNPASSPPARLWHAMVYDEVAERIVLFGGFDFATRFDDSWAYESATNTWTNRNPSVRPAGRLAPAMAYDARAGRVILFGGATSAGPQNDTWAYDYANNTWTNLDPAGAPPARNGHSMAYGPLTGRVLLFGGGTGTEFVNDTWAYDYANNTWTNLRPATSPTRRFTAVMATDPRNGDIVMNGGITQGYVRNGETWLFDDRNNSWINRTQALGPSPRGSSAMSFDSRLGLFVLMGGETGYESDETWFYDSLANRWTPADPFPRPRGRTDFWFRL